MENKKLAIAGLLAFTLLIGSVYAYGMGGFGMGWHNPGMMGYGYTEIQTEDQFVSPCGGYAHGWDHGHGWEQLTEEQKETLQEKMTEIHKLLDEYGIAGHHFVDEDGNGICDYAETGYIEHRFCGSW
jgi:hypothetical protein